MYPVYKENSLFLKSNNNEQNRPARKMIAMTQTLNNASEFQGGTSLYQGPQESFAQEPQLYVAWKTKLKYSSQSFTQLSTQPTALSPQFSV